MAATSNSPGAATDAGNNPVFDPSKNVLDLVDAAMLRIEGLVKAGERRQDDLREADARTLEAESKHIREIMDIRERYEMMLREQEKQRIDAIRAVDAAAIQRRDEVASQLASNLAQQLIATADAARLAREADAASSLEARETALNPIREDVRALRDFLNTYQGGKQQGTDTRLLIGAAVGVAGLLFGIVSKFM